MNQALGYFLIVICVVNMFFLLFRNTLVFKWRSNSREAISKYLDFLIAKRLYNMNISYYDEMQIEYFRHIFSFWLWGSKSSIKAEYKDLLEPYFEMINKDG